MVDPIDRRARTIRLVPIATLSEYAQNARTHSEEQVEMIAESIKRYGFTNPILVDAGNVIIAGHGRFAAAKLLGMDKVPTIQIDYLTEPEVRALRLADNKLAEMSKWDPLLLAADITELASVDVSFKAQEIGFDDKFLSKIGLGGASKDGDGKDDTQQDTKEFLLVVTCTDEPMQAQLYTELAERGYNVRIME